MGEGEGRNLLYYLLLYDMLYFIAVLYIFRGLRTPKSNFVFFFWPLNTFLSLDYCLCQHAALHVSYIPVLCIFLCCTDCETYKRWVEKRLWESERCQTYSLLTHSHACEKTEALNSTSCHCMFCPKRWRHSKNGRFSGDKYTNIL